MKILDLSPISSVNEFPFKSGSLQFIQDSYKEAVAQSLTSLIENVSPSQVYILSGCYNANTSPVYNVSKGVVYFNGELFDVPAFTFTTTGSQLPYPTIYTTQYTTNADPVTYTDGTPRNVHNIRSFQVTATTTFAGVMQYDSWYRVAPSLRGDIKEIAVDNAYMTANFDGTGLGIKERTGWAICNGANGTLNKKGKVSIGFDSVNYAILGATGGSKDAVAVAHEHQMFVDIDNPDSADVDSTHYVARRWSSGGDNDYRLTKVENTSTLPSVGRSGIAGVSGTDKNMQPYVVSLFIQKIV